MTAESVISEWTTSPPSTPGRYWRTTDGTRFRIVRVGLCVSRYGVQMGDEMVEHTGVGIGWNTLPTGGLWCPCQPPEMTAELIASLHEQEPTE